MFQPGQVRRGKLDEREGGTGHSPRRGLGAPTQIGNAEPNHDGIVPNQAAGPTVVSCLRWLRCSCGSLERCDRVFRLVEYLKQGHKLGYLKNLICPTTNAGKSDVPADFPSRRVQGH